MRDSTGAGPGPEPESGYGWAAPLTTGLAPLRAALKKMSPPPPTQPPVAAYATTVRAQAAILITLNAQIAAMEEQVEAHFGQHPDAETLLIYRRGPLL